MTKPPIILRLGDRVCFEGFEGIVLSGTVTHQAEYLRIRIVLSGAGPLPRPTWRWSKRHPLDAAAEESHA